MIYGNQFYDFIIISPTRQLFDIFVKMNSLNKHEYHCVIKIEDIRGLSRELPTVRIGYRDSFKFNMLDVEELGYKAPRYFGV